MQTVVQLGNSNCSWCLNDMVDQLRSRPLVRDVKINASSGCLEVTHDHDDIEALLADVRDTLRGSVEAPNGEVIWVELDAHLMSQCNSAGHVAHDQDDGFDRGR